MLLLGGHGLGLRVLYVLRQGLLLSLRQRLWGRRRFVRRRPLLLRGPALLVAVGLHGRDQSVSALFTLLFAIESVHRRRGSLL